MEKIITIYLIVVGSFWGLFFLFLLISKNKKPNSFWKKLEREIILEMPPEENL